MPEHAIYQIGLKCLLQKDELFLILKDTKTGHLDLPGGRINADETALSLSNILDRELREELGASLTYKLGGPLFQYRRTPFRKGMDVFITVYGGEFISGNITLSDEHSSHEWIDPKTFSFQKSDFGNTEEYTQIQNYFNLVSGR